MQILEFVTWEKTVLPAWRSNHPDIVAPNESIWTQFPNDIMWHSALIEADDINKLCLRMSNRLTITNVCFYSDIRAHWIFLHHYKLKFAILGTNLNE